MRVLLLALIAVCFAGACTGMATLRPAATAKVVANGDVRAAVNTIANVRVAVIPRDWPGRAPISQEVTPLKVRIDNHGKREILIRYGAIRLVEPEGRVYAALPPYRINAHVRELELELGYHPVLESGVVSSGFAISPLYAPLYPTLPRTARTYPDDTLYYGLFGNYWRSIALPTENMLRLALPEGVLEPGGNVEGYVYFQRVDPDVPSVRFRMDITGADGSLALGSVEIPLLVS